MESVREIVEKFQQVLTGKLGWVLFENGTLVIMTKETSDVRGRAIEILREFGPVYVGSPAGDFNVTRTTATDGVFVTGHHPDVITYVSPDEVAQHSNDLSLGILGRTKRDMDGKNLIVVHVEEPKA